MTSWIKKQLTEITAWAGFACVICALFAPRWVFIVIGIILISTDDDKARAWVHEKAPKVSNLIDKWNAS